MNRKLSISLLAGAALGIASAASAQSNRDEGLALSAEIAAQNAAMANSLQAAGGPEVFGHAKIRFTYNSRKDVPPLATSQDAAWGFSNSETRLGVRGSVDSFDYVVDGDFGTDGSFALNNANGNYNMENGWGVKFGQFKNAFTREEAVSDTGLLDADRSIVNTAFSAGYVQGIQAHHAAEDWRLAITLSDGARTQNTDFASETSDFGLTARFEYKIRGADWDAFNDFTSFRGSDYSVMVGGAAHYQTGGESFQSGGTGATAETDVTGLTIDASAEGNGWNAFASIVWINTDPDGGSKSDDFGYTVQGGYFLNDSWEGFARYAATSPDSDSGADDFSALSVGVNHYFIPESHAAKFTPSVVFFLDEQSGGIVSANTENSLLASTEDSQWALRAQFQLEF